MNNVCTRITAKRRGFAWDHRDDAYFLFGVSAKHFNDDVSTTVSQNATTGSATLMSADRGLTSPTSYMDRSVIQRQRVNVSNQLHGLVSYTETEG